MICFIQYLSQTQPGHKNGRLTEDKSWDRELNMLLKYNDQKWIDFVIIT